MEHWPWWAGGTALAGVMLLHWALTRRELAVSGRLTALVDRARHGAPAPVPEMSSEELLEALRGATAAEFGGTADAAPIEATAAALPARRLGEREHLVFFAALVLGGALASIVSGGIAPELLLRGEGLTATFGPLAPLALVVGGVLVGFGTRMAGGCTSGHGLNGVSRMQVGSIAATATFFGVGVITSLILGALS